MKTLHGTLGQYKGSLEKATRKLPLHGPFADEALYPAKPGLSKHRHSANRGPHDQRRQTQNFLDLVAGLLRHVP